LVLLRELWGLSPDDGMYLALQLADVPGCQVIRRMFPHGIAKQVLGITDGDEADGSALTVTVPVS
jgi:hypothetical protein